jgi:membrane dipeptidase
MIERRLVLKTLGAAALAWPSILAADERSQQPFVDAMAYLSTNYSNRLLDEIRESGLHACVVSLGVPSVGGNSGLRRVIGDLRDYQEFIDDHRSHLMMGRTADDVVRAKDTRRIALFFEIENASVLADDVDRVDQFHRLGVRVMQLTHNGRNDIGDGYLEATNAGLSKLGIDVVERMDALGMLVDLAHCGEATSMGAISVGSKPAVISHAACRAIYESPRNKSDELLRSLAGKGGVVGIFQARGYLGATSADSLELYLRHIDHAVDVAGIDHVAVGSDREFRAVPNTAEERRRLGDLLERERSNEDDNSPPTPWPYYVQTLDGPSRTAVLADALKERGRTSDEIDKILGGNLQRLFRDTLK